VILMQQNFNGITFLTGSKEVLRSIATTGARPMFSIEAMDFLAALSKEILSDKRTKAFPDVTTYAFWIRKASLEKVRQSYTHTDERIGRGVAFHIAPSNVPVNFAVSFTSALLAGNACIVRVSNKYFTQTDIICDAINRLFYSCFSCMAQYLCIIRYEHNEEITQTLSSMCDIRIIWGGNRTIDIIRQAKLSPRAIELSFADRHSLAIINADEYLKADKDRVALDFYTDTYYTDQNACSAPRIVVWMGKKVSAAREVFWSTLEELVKKDYHMHSIQCIDKLSSFCKLAATHTGIRVEGNSNFIVRVVLPEIFSDIMDYKESGGYFFEYFTDKLCDIVPILTKSCQTVSYLGINSNEIKKIVYSYGTRGVDRIVPIGQTMELSFTWDGYDMIEAMSRKIYCK